MSLLKDVCIEAIKRMPENITVEDIICEIIIIGNIVEPLQNEGRETTVEEVLERVDKWKENRTITNEEIIEQSKAWRERSIMGIREKLIIIDKKGNIVLSIQ
jgi:hypothetical protein